MNEEEKQRIPRFTYSIPKEIEQDVIEEMRADVRLSPSELINAVLIQHYRDRINIQGIGNIATRFSYSIPDMVREQFLKDMADEVRSSPADLVNKILVMHYRERARDKMLKDMKSNGELAAEPKKLPYFGPTKVESKPAQDEARSGDE